DTAIILLENEKVLAKTKQKWIILCAVILVLPLSLLFIFYRHRAKTQLKIRQQENEIHNKEKLRLQKEQELTEIKALIEGQDKERNRIAKELHDGVGGQLASVNLRLSHINNTLGNDKIIEIGNNLTGTLKELRLLSHNLSTNSFIGKSFDVLLNELKQQYDNPKQFEIEISVFPEDCFEHINDDVKHNLYRILQEALANISKHAKANFVSLSFTRHVEHFTIFIEDNGIGFDQIKSKDGIGIHNIKERLLAINGSIEIDSSPNRGTHLVIEIPLTTISKE
ncbi:MAG: sensor histidine kinase, partial [Bacteroidetes bacterium]|nr:sensor histidine kinase [Bacteroidota bacterium]